MFDCRNDENKHKRGCSPFFVKKLPTGSENVKIRSLFIKVNVVAPPPPQPQNSASASGALLHSFSQPEQGRML